MTPRSRNVVVGIGAVCLLGLIAILAATQLRPERGVVPLSRGDVPFGLLRDTPPPVRQVPSGNEELAPVFLVYHSALVPVSRPVPKGQSSEALTDALVRGPTDDEASRGLTTLLTPDTEPSKVRLDGDVAVVELRAPVSPGVPGDRHLAIAQLVYTLTAIDGVDAVRFELGGDSAEVPIGNGTLTRSAVTRADFPVQVLAVLP